MTAAAKAFDRLAPSYDALWTNAPAGRLQRHAVWRVLDSYVGLGTRVLDLGCGTGEDAVHLQNLGAAVDAVDASPAMVQIARAKGVRARVLTIENAERITTRYDLVLSNFGALNCVRDVEPLYPGLARLVRPGGLLLVCLLNRVCAWEMVFHAARWEWRNCVRRLRGVHHASLGITVYYHSARRIKTALAPAFSLHSDYGIGLAVPPSYVPIRHQAWMRAFAYFDRLAASSVAARALADHRLLVFTRN